MNIVYDFDKTLTYKDTLMGYFFFFSKNYLKRAVYIFFAILAKYNLISNIFLKKIGVKLFLEGLDKNYLEKKSFLYAKTIKTNKIYKEIDFSKNIIILTASFEEYIKFLFPKNVKIFASKIKYTNDKVEKFEFNCYKKNKIKILKANKLKVDLFFTDSYSDVFVAKEARKIIIVKSDKKIVCNSFEDFKRYFKK